MEIFYLFSVRYVHGASLTWSGILGTRAVLIGVAMVTLAQIAFTYLPLAHDLLESRPLSLRDGLIIVGAGIALFGIVEIEKRVRGAIRDPSTSFPADRNS
jgi:magnesium-transporting ATPase (P-type)